MAVTVTKNQLKDFLRDLLHADALPFDDKLRSLLPDKPGIYRIFEMGSDWKSSLRVGRTDAEGGLRQRVYQNHLMGNQPGNIRAQLVSDKTKRCSDSEKAKEFLITRCKVQFLVIEDDNQRKWAEHFILSILQPEYSD